MSTRQHAANLRFVALIAALYLASALVGLPVDSLNSQDRVSNAPPYAPAQILPSLGGAWSTALDISATGQIAGVASTAKGPAYAVRWPHAHGVENLGALPGAGSLAHGINAQDQVIGEIVASRVPPWAFIWQPDTGLALLPDLGGDSGTAYDINDAGEIVGVSKTKQHNLHACLWTADHEIVDLGTLGGTNSIALAINDSGHVVGKSQTTDGTWHVFLWTQDAGLRDLGAIGKSPDPTSINQQNVIVGRSLFDGALGAWRWSQERGLEMLPGLGGTYSCANDINDLAQVVGWAEDGNGVDHAVLWNAAGQVRTISRPEEAGALALAINDRGQVVGQIPTSGTEMAAVVWDLKE